MLNLYGQTALELWRRCPPELARNLHWARTREISDGRATKAELARLGSVWSQMLTPPYHVLVGQNRHRHVSTAFVTHCCRGCDVLPPRSLYSLGPGIAVSSPALSFVQLAYSLDSISAIMLAMGLMGFYRLQKDSSVLYWQEPLITHDEAARIISLLGKTKGIAKARRAIKHAISGSASPRESALVLALTLPTRLGGFQLPRPLLNHRIELTQLGHRLARKGYVRCDIYWPEYRLAVEYDSDEFHDPDGVADEARRDALEAMGITVVPIHTRQFNNFNEFYSRVLKLRAHMGLQSRPQVVSQMRHRMQVHAQLRAPYSVGLAD